MTLRQEDLHCPKCGKPLSIQQSCDPHTQQTTMACGACGFTAVADRPWLVL